MEALHLSFWMFLVKGGDSDNIRACVPAMRLKPQIALRSQHMILAVSGGRQGFLTCRRSPMLWRREVLVAILSQATSAQCPSPQTEEGLQPGRAERRERQLLRAIDLHVRSPTVYVFTSPVVRRPGIRPVTRRRNSGP